MTDGPVDGQAAQRQWPRGLLRMVVLYGLVPYLAVTLLMAAFQRKLMYQPTVARNLSVKATGLNGDRIRDVQLRTPDGALLKGWLLKGDAPAAQATPGDDAADQPVPNSVASRRPPLVIYFPGNAGHRWMRVEDLYEIAERGFDVLIFDYRGYGDSTSSPSESRLTADARLVWDFACDELHYSPDRIVIFGESLGGAVALSLWSTTDTGSPQPAAVMLNATFASMTETVAWHYPWFPFRYLLLDHWPSLRRIGRVSSPIVIFHGTADMIVPVEHGRELARAAAAARIIEIPHGGHNGLPQHELRIELDRLRSTLAK